MNSIIKNTAAGLATLSLSTAVMAHPGHVSDLTVSMQASLASGFLHPLMGLDHLLMLLGIGLMARYSRILPVYLLALIAGMLAAFNGFQIPLVEEGIAASLIMVGLSVFALSKGQLSVRFYGHFAYAVALFGLFHGAAHGGEVASGLSLTAYGVGIVLSSVLVVLVARQVSRGSFAIKLQAKPIS